MPDVTLEILRSIQQRLANIEARVERFGSVDAKVEAGFALVDVRLSEINARLDLIDGHIVGLEHSVLNVSARTFSTATQHTRSETTIERHARELAELRARVEKLEEPTRP